MRGFLIALFCVVACLVCAPQAEAAGPVRNLLRAIAGKAKDVIVAPLKARPLRRLVGRGC